jgi:dienelactone hydrolase
MMFSKWMRLSVLFGSSAILFLSVEVLAQQPTTSSPAAPATAPAQSPGIPRSQLAPVPKLPQALPTQGLDPKTGEPLYETIRENWSSLQIGDSELTPERPIASDVDEQDRFTRQLVVVKWRPGDHIDLWIAMPKGVKNPPVVLYLYGYKEDTERFRDNGWCERATAGGVAAVGFVSAMSGQRFHDRPMKQWFVSELQESLGSTVHDVKFILDYLTSRGDMDMSKVGMFGEGSGGAIAILSAAADPRIKAIDLLEPWGDWPNFLSTSVVLLEDPEHDNYKKPEFVHKVETLEPVKWLPKLKIPIRMQQVKDDASVSMEAKEALKDALPKDAQVRRFETKMAMFNSERGGVLFDWVKDRLNEIGRKSSVAVQNAEGKPSGN